MRVLATLLVAALRIGGQTPSFEAASIKPAADANPKKQREIKFGSGNLSLQGAALWDLIAAAYDIRTYQLSGPDWMKTERFDIAAKVPEGATLDEKRLMLQSLLIERFKLAIHHDTKELAIDTLVAGKGGPKIGSRVSAEGRNTVAFESGKLMFHNFTMSQLATYLSRSNPNGTIVDATGIDGRYDFGVDIDTKSGRPEEVKGAIEQATLDGSLARVVPQQLGLKIETRKQPTDLVVVDRVERIPAEN